MWLPSGPAGRTSGGAWNLSGRRVEVESADADEARVFCQSRVLEQPVDDVRRDLVAVDLVEDLVTGAVVDGDRHVLEACVAVPLCEEFDELPIPRQGVGLSGN